MKIISICLATLLASVLVLVTTSLTEKTEIRARTLDESERTATQSFEKSRVLKIQKTTPSDSMGYCHRVKREGLL